MIQRTYALNLAKKLRKPFARLVKRTKRKHREIFASLNNKTLDDHLKETTDPKKCPLFEGAKYSCY